MFTTRCSPNHARSLWIGCALLILLGMVLFASTAWGRSPMAVSEESTITIFGYGDATAAAKSAQVILRFGASAAYGPEGATFTPPDEDGVQVVLSVLAASGIATDTITVDLYSPNGYYGPSNQTTVSFQYDQPEQLNALFTDLLEQVKELRGPVIQNAEVTYLLADCATLEKQAWQAALDNAQQRAEQAADLLGVQVGALTQVAEKSTGTFDQALSGCAALEAASHATDYAFGAATPLNSAAQVEVTIGVQASYAIAP